MILFLDELILWLASHAADLSFVHQEGQKLAKLVEAQTAVGLGNDAAEEAELLHLVDHRLGILVGQLEPRRVGDDLGVDPTGNRLDDPVGYLGVDGHVQSVEARER